VTEQALSAAPLVEAPTPVAAKSPVAARRGAIAVFAAAVIVAAYTGFRLPNDWTATLDAVSITEGFHRRFLLGSILHPIAVATGYNYWVFATKSYLVLAALLAVATVAMLRARLTSQRLLLIGWLLLPTGGYLFHEVGYYDQVLYLLLFGALWALHRNRPIIASLLMTIGVLVHEITVLTVLPIFAMAALRRMSLRHAILAVLPAAAVAGVVLVAVRPSTPGSASRLGNALAHANFPYRADALALFDRTQGQSWQMYKISDVLTYLAPFAIVMVVAFALLASTDTGLAGPNGKPAGVSLTGAAHIAAACVAIGAPLLLAFAGWDQERWGFLLVTNFVIVLWLHLADTGRELGRTQILVLVLAMLIITHIPLTYFDGYAARPFQWPAFRDFLHQISDHSLFAIPKH
jgi:hypothetical protein